MSNTQRNVVGECVLVPPSWRAGVFVLIQIVVVVLVAVGYPPQTALACVAGGGMAAGHVVRQLFAVSLPAREA
ncbi:hypothetical protein [Streptomyces sp. NPDC001604]|uniref:hypothetical protein n=1 Tax=Streptomyces sp. NPDC001604 TaxID=3364593 RepID=UPI00367661C3